MSWKKYLPDYQVPAVFEGLIRSGVLKDKTSERDSAVRLEGRLQGGDTLVLWIDHPSPLERIPGDGRYTLAVWREDKFPETVAEGDNTEEMVLEIQDMLGRLGGPRMVS